MSSEDHDSGGNTRRRFLGGTLAGAAAAVFGGRVAGAPTGTTSSTSTTQEDLEFSCSAVENLQSQGATAARVEFADGSYVQANDGVPDRIGSPGRALERVRFFGDGEETVENPNSGCDPGETATAFTDGRAFVGPAEFDTSTGSPIPDTRVVLHFADGTSQEVVGTGDNPELGFATTYRGEGKHAGKTIEAIEFDRPSFATTRHLRNPDVAGQLLGASTPRERVVEVVGASEGEVEYEFTAEGPVERASLTDRLAGGNNDSLSDNGDGTVTVSGFTGNTGYGDAFVVNGELTGFNQTGGSGEYVVRETERRVTHRSYDDPSLVRIVGTESGEVSYEFTVDGVVHAVRNTGEPLKADGNDQVTDNGDGTWTVSGYTGNEGYGDTYVVAGDVTAFQQTGGDAAFDIERDGRTVSQDEFVDGN